jgi:hypothetical protein
MLLLCQNIAIRANHDDREVGKFWQSRYRAVRLLDESALLACAAYGQLTKGRGTYSTVYVPVPFVNPLTTFIEELNSYRSHVNCYLCMGCSANNCWSAIISTGLTR